MTLLTEQDIENVTLEMLQELGHEVVHGPDIAPDSDNPKRKKWDDVILEDDLRQAIEDLNPKLPDEAVEKAKESCKNAGFSISDHFFEVIKMVPLGSGSEREVEDIMLTRYACYLIGRRKKWWNFFDAH